MHVVNPQKTLKFARGKMLNDIKNIQKEGKRKHRLGRAITKLF